jgi:hypothetical protein
VFPIKTAINFMGTFSGAVSGDVLNVAWNFDSTLTATGTATGSSGSITTPYSFMNTGVYKVTLSVSNPNYVTATTNNIAGIEAYVVIYDPNGGFVTGGGWINSPAGALVGTSLTGRANFGFVSKYAKGASVPTGETEFNFQLGNFNFHSTSYDWLVVSGALAQYKGSGTINGTGDYGFILTAADADIQGGPAVDGFRIKIYNKATGAVIYDNKMTTDDTASNQNTQAISGGSIVVHTK